MIVRVVAALHHADVGLPVRVVQELGEAVARHDNLEVLWNARLQVIEGRGGHAFVFLIRRHAEDVVAWDDILRAQGRPVVLAVLLVVEQAQLLQVRHTRQRAVGNHHLQVGVRILRVAGGLPELDVLHVRVAADGVAS